MGVKPHVIMFCGYPFSSAGEMFQQPRPDAPGEWDRRSGG